MNFPSIDIQGSIISPDLLAKIRSEQASFQLGKDFSKDFTNAKLKDEISSAWQDAKGQWTIFQNKLSRLKKDETATTETRNFWIVPLLSNLGYNLSYSRHTEEINGKSFPIAYRDNQLDNFPVYIGGFQESLDKRPESKLLRVSPHAMIQEYLNYSEHLYGLVTNGRQLRLLRDASRITRLSYVEFNLQKMMEEDLYSDFVLLFRLLHVSRMPQKVDSGAESIIEKYHHEGLVAGSTIRSKLGDAVKDTIKSLANGFINHPDNKKLREALQQGHLDADVYYRQQLRIIYRLLFLFVIEERNLVYAESKAPETKRFSQIYFKYYSLLRLRKLAKNLPPADAHRHYDLWQGLLGTFALFEETAIGDKLGIMSLQGELFGPGSMATDYYDLHDCRLSNALVLQIIKALTYFENQAGVQIAVNYGGLNVEEFGSVYEGLLELKLNIEPVAGTDNFSCSYAGSEERSKSGSHYTPDELVEPLIKHSLDYLLDDRKKIITDIISRQRLSGPAFRLQRQELVNQHIFSLKVCDIACGSGHLLISGARRIAEVAACIIEEEEQPNPKAFQLAKRAAILNCIYGVDKNPLAIELCKVALWLEAYVPGQPLNFLDHHIKCGDAIVGLAHKEELENGIADEAFKTLPGDDKEISRDFARKNRQERVEKNQVLIDFESNVGNELNEAIAEYRRFSELPETTPEEITLKQKAYRKFESETHKMRLQQLADAQVAQFFIPKTTATKSKLITDAVYRAELNHNSKALAAIQDTRFAYATAIAKQNRFFHWFLEFPEVFKGGGFDCILGNPPFLGGSKISTNYGSPFLHFIQNTYKPIGGQCDFVAYFFRRAFSTVFKGGFISLIATNSISQGDTRIGGLQEIINMGGSIVFARRVIKWPGKANVFVSLVSIGKKKVREIYLDGAKVIEINAFLENNITTSEPNAILQNENKIFKGSELVGDGFIIDENKARQFLDNNDYKKFIFRLISGDDINNEYQLIPSRWVINFKNLALEECKKFHDLYQIIEERVKPYRENNNDKRRREIWWQFSRPKLELYENLLGKQRCLGIAKTTKYLNFVFLPTIFVYLDSTYILADESSCSLAIMNSNIHEAWARKYSSSLAFTLNYSPENCFETYPFPTSMQHTTRQSIEIIGEKYEEKRKKLMYNIQLGLTKTYNLFHFKNLYYACDEDINIDDKVFEKKFGKEALHLKKHLLKTPCTISFNEAVAGIFKIRELHVEMDQAVLEAYGWSDIQLKHDFYEVDYLPENDRVRYTIHPDARKEILKRLLELNHRIHAEEVKAGLWEKNHLNKGKNKKNMITENGSETDSENKLKLGGLFEGHEIE
jgi:hypothetical protein